MVCGALFWQPEQMPTRTVTQGQTVQREKSVPTEGASAGPLSGLLSRGSHPPSSSLPGGTGPPGRVLGG